MKTLPLNVRERILAACDKGGATRQKIADRFRVSLGMVKKLLQQRANTGEIGPLHHRSGRKPIILPAHERRMESLLARKPGLTLSDLRDALKLDCSLPAIHQALKRLGLTTGRRRPKAKAKAKPALKRSGSRRKAG